MVKEKTIGMALMVTAAVLFLIGYVYISAAEQALLKGHTLGPEGECIHPEGAICPYAELNKLTMPKYLAFFADLGLFAFGLFLFLKKKPKEKAVSKARKAAKALGGDEGKVFDLIAKADGMIFQNELVKQSEFSKVKVTRVLDKLEAKGLIERRRRGMTNVIVLK